MSTVLFFYQGTALTSEISGQTKRSFFAHGRDALAEIVRLPGASSTTLLGVDRLGSITTAGPTTLRYGPYGYDRATLPSRVTVLGFTGARRGPTEGDYLLGNGYRTYKSWLMRFNSPDVMSPFLEGGINAYAYCQGDPVNFTDPSGKVKMDTIMRRRRPPTPVYDPLVELTGMVWRTPSTPARSTSASASRTATPGSSSQMMQKIANQRSGATGRPESRRAARVRRWEETASLLDKQARDKLVSKIANELNIFASEAIAPAEWSSDAAIKLSQAEINEVKAFTVKQLDNPGRLLGAGVEGRNVKNRTLRRRMEIVRERLVEEIRGQT
ncbi:RHS repeat-associated core domain-containing protein [Pseudomonas alabamensis]|uniref:RHS repeat-associated core domain-containing protein n=1 Tax=Pseudomonas alabamensis TaxID=3064349 RepID=UPI003F650086